MDLCLVDSAWSAVAPNESTSNDQKTVPISHFFTIIHEIERLSLLHQPEKSRPKASLLSTDAIEVVKRLITKNSAASISKFQFTAILNDLLTEDNATSVQNTGAQIAAQRRAEALKKRQCGRRSLSLYTQHSTAEINNKKPTCNSVPLASDQKVILTRQLSAYELQLQQLQENETRRLQYIEDIEHELESAQSELITRRQQQNAEFSKTRLSVDVINAEEEKELIQKLFGKEISAWDDVKDRLNQLEDEKNEYLSALSTMSAERSGYLLVIDNLNQQLSELRLEISSLNDITPTYNNSNYPSSAEIRLTLDDKSASHYDFMSSLFAGQFAFTYLAFAVIGACVVGIILPFLTTGGIHYPNRLI